MKDIVIAPEVRVKAGEGTDADLPPHAVSCRVPIQPGAVTFPAPRQAESVESGAFSAVVGKPDLELALCPQGNDCAGEMAPTRVFECEQGCGFRGCAACMRVHDDEPHVSDSDTMLAMVREIGGPG